MEPKNVTFRMGRRFLRVTVIFAVLIGFVNCVPGTIPVDRRIPLAKGGSQTGTWKTFDYTMNYKYVFNQENVQQPGSIDLSGSVQTDGGALNSLDIWVNFVDAQGNVLIEKSAYSTGYRSSRGRNGKSFSVKLETPPGTTAMAFTHASERQSGHQ